MRDHFETFRSPAAGLRDGQGLPRFVEQEFRDFLTCGCLAAGFARFRYVLAWDHALCRAVVGVYAAGAGLSFVSPVVALALYAGIAALWVIPDRRFE